MLRLALAALVGTAALSTALPAPVAAQQLPLPDGEIDGMMAQQALAMLADDPETLSTLGIIPPGGADSPYARLTLVDTDYRARQMQMLEQFLARSAAIDPATLPADQQLSLAIWRAYLGNEMAVLESGAFSTGSPYVIDQFWVQELPNLFISTHQLNSPFMADAWVERMEQVPEVLAARQALFEAEAERGMLPPRLTLDVVVDDIDALLAPAPEDHPIYRRFVADLPQEIPAEDAARLRERALAGLRDGFYPAYRAMQAAVAAQRDNARTEQVGILGVPGGDAIYAAYTRRWTTVEIDPEAVHRRGLEEVTRIRAEMDRRLTALGFTEGTFAQRMRAASQAGLYGLADDETGAQALLDRTQEMVEEARRKTAPFFHRFPQTEIITVPVPESAEASANNSYTRPAADGSRPGVFNLNLGDPAAYGDIGYPSLVYHETIPGHHYQLALQMESDLPLVRRFLPFSAYSEGWALYVETIAEDMGLYDENPIGVLGALSSELFRAARLVVDSGIHHRGWSREQAEQFMLETMGDPNTREINRYIVWPGQALTYKTGQLAIADMRREAEERLGDHFDLAAFHDEILRGGAMPLSVLRTRIEAWVDNQAQ